MESQNQLPEYLLHIPPKMWQEFCKNMLEARSINEEVIGFFFCKSHQISKLKFRYIPKAWVVPLQDCYELQSNSGLVLAQKFHSYILEKYLQDGLHVVHIHTHIGEATPEFSSVDDYYESEYANFLTHKFSQKIRLISGVFNQSLQKSKFRIWNRKGKNYYHIDFCNSYLTIGNFDANFALNTVQEEFEQPFNSQYQNVFDNETTANSFSKNFRQSTTKSIFGQQNYSNNQNLMFARQKIFGDACQKQLHELKISLIGCGGIGASFAESLGRLGVKNWVLIDSDRLETVNLNRMPGATPKMVDQQWYKVGYVKYLIKKIYPTGSNVKAIPTSCNSEIAQREIAGSDLIIVATDNHLSRKQAQELALTYMRPLVCLGTHIDINPSDNTPRMFCRVTVPPLGGGWCLMCGNIINLQKAAVESAPTQINQMVNRAGYLEGVNDPAVFWLNSICASTGVGVIHGMVSGFLNLDTGIDWIYEFPNSVWHQIDTKYLETPDCYFCSQFDGLTTEIENIETESDVENMGYW
ncbi:ThiF family adenylyltransferase [Nostoc sp. TCL26-01]|uniref:ThiF family adenylyltransferase n=1 Tax=Nostoc sp. TCL26-01 TaxID=2576904 RepID=UPI0015BC4F48|nr:ThiF family adenylyltransferase [Nostoc sp. TCL26-01]QLE56397.1 ThiF family adenylyltransferase [Nostoc sp. TCL26-01]